MPLYFFHLRDGNSLIEDPDGSELPDLGAAREEALASARELLANRILAGQVVDGQRFEVTDEHGELLDVVMLRDAMRLPSKEGDE